MENLAVRRLIFWNRFWLGLLVVALLLGFGQWLITASDLLPTSLRAVWHNGGLALVTGSDGPFVVTHLILDGHEAADESQKAVAQLSNPVVIIDSKGAIISPEEVKKLTWKDTTGQSVPPPHEGTPIRALYYRPLRTPPATR
jgi:hypothetical protein